MLTAVADISKQRISRYFRKGRLLRRINREGLAMELRGLIYFWRRPSLFRVIRNAIKVSPSTGCNFAELEELHRTVVRDKPARVLELGSGLSTLVLAHAAMEGSSQGARIEVVSMDEHSGYAGATLEIIPQLLRPFVEIVVSEVVETSFADGWTGREYKDRPNGPWDFCFIDGPQLPKDSRERKFFDADLISILRQQSTPVVAFLDGRESTLRRLRIEPKLVATVGRFLTRFDTR
jgi:hypothetical protein